MVAEEPEVIHIDPDSDIARHLDMAGDRPLIIEYDGVRFEVRRESPGPESSDPGRVEALIRSLIQSKPLNIAHDEDPFADYDPEKARKATRKAAGRWRDVDAEALKELIYRAREEGSQSFDQS